MVIVFKRDKHFSSVINYAPVPVFISYCCTAFRETISIAILEGDYFFPRLVDKPPFPLFILYCCKRSGKTVIIIIIILAGNNLLPGSVNKTIKNRTAGIVYLYCRKPIVEVSHRIIFTGDYFFARFINKAPFSILVHHRSAAFGERGGRAILTGNNFSASGINKAIHPVYIAAFLDHNCRKTFREVTN